MITYRKVESTRYILELSYSEARALAEVLARVGGSPDTGRGYTTSILDALQAMEINWGNYQEKVSGQIKFEDVNDPFVSVFEEPDLDDELQQCRCHNCNHIKAP